MPRRAADIFNSGPNQPAERDLLLGGEQDRIPAVPVKKSVFPDFIICLGEIAILPTAFGPVLTGILVAWLQSRAARKMRLKDGDVEVEARTVEEAETLLDMVAEQRAKRERKED